MALEHLDHGRKTKELNFYVHFSKMNSNVHVNSYTWLLAALLAKSWDGCEDEEKWCSHVGSSARHVRDVGNRPIFTVPARSVIARCLRISIGPSIHLPNTLHRSLHT